MTDEDPKVVEPPPKEPPPKVVEPSQVVEPVETTVPLLARWLRPRRVAAFVVAAMLLYYLANLAAVYRAGRADEAAPVDAIVVLGAAQYDGRPSPQLAARLDHVVTLWHQGLAEHVVVTGGKQPGDRFTEATASRNYLVERGVPEAAVLAEDVSHNTYDSLAAVAVLLREAGLTRVLLVTDPFHTARAELIAAEVGLDARSSPTPTSVVGGWESFRLELKEAAGVSLGRIVGFRRLTDLTG
ncbi:MAG TPA: YdcF family protein [Ilumatobacter sp.]|nr:YdcF family protein [Ilumatobacter sp.]